LDRVMPRVSVARLPDKVAQKRHARRLRRKKRKRRTSTTAGAQASATDAKEMPKVVMFSTSWCPSCKVARQYFTQKGVHYVDLDVEKNQAAAQKMVEIQKARGMKAGAVPLIIIGNQVYQGFSQMQIEAGLAQLQGQSPAG
jgi:glutaredoxin 3